MKADVIADVCRIVRQIPPPHAIDVLLITAGPGPYLIDGQAETAVPARIHATANAAIG